MKITFKDVIIDFVALALVGFFAVAVLVLCFGFSSNAEESTSNEYYVEYWSFLYNSNIGNHEKEG